MNRPGPKPRDVKERFLEKVKKSGTCWNWDASIRRGGYGRFTINGKSVVAHRFSYELLIGPIPEGMQLDHLCRNRKCVNPDHLEPVTLQENLRRGEGNKKATIAAAKKRMSKKYCKRGHPYDSINTYIRPDGGRDCRTCARIRRGELK